MHFNLNQHLSYLWLITAAMIAGVMNAMAGGGSFVSFPAMLAMGVPPVEANATNTVALWPGQLTSLATLRHDVRRDILPAVAMSSIVGGILGAEVLVHTRQATFLHLIPWLILGGTAIFGLSSPISRWLRRRSVQHHAVPPIHPWALGLALLPVTFYVGYFGAGGGFVAMTVLALFGMEEMHALNAMKVVVALLSNLCAILTFVIEGRIVWHYCLIAMIFAALGGWVGAKFVRRANGEVLRWGVVATGLAISAYFFWKQAHG